MKTVTLTTPYTKSPVVRVIQKYLGVPADAEYGPVTASAVQHWKYTFGYPKLYINNQVTASDYAYLRGARPQTKMMKARAASRAKKELAQKGIGVLAMESMVSWARAGWHEFPDRSNVVPQMGEVAKKAGLSKWYCEMGWPWCAFSAMLAGFVHGGKTAQAGFAGKFNVLYVPDILAAAQRNLYGMRVVSWDNAKPGDLVIFNFDGGVVDHIGRVVEVLDNGICRTVEGNTSGGGAGSQANGGGMFMRSRGRAEIAAFVRDS